MRPLLALCVLLLGSVPAFASGPDAVTHARSLTRATRRFSKAAQWAYERAIRTGSQPKLGLVRDERDDVTESGVSRTRHYGGIGEHADERASLTTIDGTEAGVRMTSVIGSHTYPLGTSQRFGQDVRIATLHGKTLSWSWTTELDGGMSVSTIRLFASEKRLWGGLLSIRGTTEIVGSKEKGQALRASVTRNRRSLFLGDMRLKWLDANMTPEETAPYLE